MIMPFHRLSHLKMNNLNMSGCYTKQQASSQTHSSTFFPTCLLEPKCACSCFQSTADIKRLVTLSSSSPSSAGHGQPQLPGRGPLEKNGFPGRIHHLPDLIQQSHHSTSSSTTIPSFSSSSSSSTTTTSSSLPSSSSHASPAVSPQISLDELTAIEVCRHHTTKGKQLRSGQ